MLTFRNAAALRTAEQFPDFTRKDLSDGFGVANLASLLGAEPGPRIIGHVAELRNAQHVFVALLFEGFDLVIKMLNGLSECLSLTTGCVRGVFAKLLSIGGALLE